MNISITDNIRQSWLGKLDVQGRLPRVVERVAKIMENKAKSNINTRVYGQPPSKYYVRTGRAQRSIIANKQSNISYKVLSDTRVAGATKNYTPYLNRNKRIRRLNTHFWDDAVKDTQSKVQDIIQDIIF